MQECKRLLFVSSDKYPPFRVDVSVLLGKELVKRGFCIDAILQAEGDCRRRYTAPWAGGTTYVGATDNGERFFNRLRKHILKLWNDLRVIRIASGDRHHIILAKDVFLSALPSLWTAKIKGIKFVYWLSYPFPEASLHEVAEGTARYPLAYWVRGHLFKMILYRFLLPASDHVFVQSEQMKADLAASGVPPEKLTPIPMGVDLANIQGPEFGDGANTDRSERRIVYLGTLAGVRRLDFLVRVLARVIEREPRAVLYLVGKGERAEDEAAIVKEARRLGVQEAVVLTGFLPMAQAWGVVGSAEVCVSPFFPSFVLNSTSPTKLVEYMALGKPVVANHHPEQSLVISESGAGLCVPYDEASFADAIVELLRNRGKAQEMAARGRRYVESVRSYAKICDLLDGQLQALIQR